MEEWGVHPLGAPVLSDALSSFGDSSAAMVGEEILKMLGSMPLRTMIGFSAQGASEPVDVDEILTRMLDRVSEAQGVTA